MSMYYNAPRSDELYHYGVMGMKWGVRRYQNSDGSLTEAGRRKYNIGEAKKNLNAAKTKRHDAIVKANTIQSKSLKREDMLDMQERKLEADKELVKANQEYKQAKKEYKKAKAFTPEQKKRAVIIGAAVAGTGLAVYGGYKVSKAIKAYKVDKAKWAETRKIVDEYKELKRFNLGGMAMRDADERIARAGLKALSKR